MNSLRTRLLIVATVVLIVFLGLTGGVLDRAFQQSALSSERLRLQTYINDLLRVADARGNTTQLIVPGTSIDRQLVQPNSGLYASASDNQGNIVWSSSSLMDVELPFITGLDPGEREFNELSDPTLGELFELSMGIAWVEETGDENYYTINVAQTTEIYEHQLREFRRGVWFWLGGVVIVLIVVQGVILRWGLAPLNTVARDVQAIENGEQQSLTGEYPAELRGLTSNLNALIKHERNRQSRYQHAMADLAHSLKTPLAVLRNAVESPASGDDLHRTIGEQVDRLDQITRYQLQRAQTSGKRTFQAPIKVRPLVLQIAHALNKVYIDKQVQFTHNISEDSVFYGEQGDFMEVMGNLLDNAYKYCDHKVNYTAHMQAGENPGLYLALDNDGKCIPENKLTQILQRGQRADTTQVGYGIGLAVVNEIVNAYAGTIEFQNTSPEQGTMVQVFLPK